VYKDFQIRRFRPPDREAVLEIAKNAFAGVNLDENIEMEFGPAGKAWSEHKQDVVEYDLINNPSLVLIAERYNKTVGFVCARIYQRRSTGHISNLAVKGECRGKKIGRSLVKESMDLLRSKGVEFVRIETLEQNQRGKHLYPSLGFREVGRQIFYFKKL